MLEPRKIVELGTHHGFSYLAFCQAVDACGLDTRCYAVDTWEGDDQAGFYENEVYDNLRLLNEEHYRAFSTLIRSRFDQALPYFSEGEIDLLHIDGHHTYEDVLEDFTLWKPKLSDKAIVLFHDTNVRRDNFGVWKIWQELAPLYPSIEFPHGNGLGILGVGKSLPEHILEFLNADVDDTRNLQLAYATLGGAVTTKFLKNAMQAEAAALSGQVDVLNNKLKSLNDQKNEQDLSLLEKISDLQEEYDQKCRELAISNEELNYSSSSIEKMSAEILRLESQFVADSAVSVSNIVELDNCATEIETVTIDGAVSDGSIQEPINLDPSHEVRAPQDNEQILLERIANLHHALAHAEARLAERQSAYSRLEIQHTGLTHHIQSIESSTFWRMTKPLKQILEKMPSPVRRNFRRSAKAMWWLATPHRLPQRIAFIRARNSAQTLTSPTVANSYNHLTPPTLIAPAISTLDVGIGRSASSNVWFDADFYAEQVPLLAETGMDPYTHYVSHGWRAGYDPHPLFNTEWFVKNNPRLLQTDLNPLEAFLGQDVGSPVISKTIPRNWLRSSTDFGDVPTIMPAFYTPPGRANFAIMDEHRLHALLATSDVLSFDIFDTALVRRVAHPTTVFDILANRAERLDARMHTLADIRFWAERVARKRSSDTSGTMEIGLSEIYDEIQRELKLSAEERDIIQNLECEIEKEVLVANPNVLRWYRHAKSIGKTVIFVSDMYLPASFLIEILAEAGYDSPQVYVSCDLPVGKWEKKLFQVVADRLQTKPENILHVGDNAQSDKINADLSGWKGFHFTEHANEQPYALQLATPVGLNISNVAVSVSCGLSHTHRLQIESAEMQPTERFAHHLGYEIIGPTILAFAGWVASKAQSDNLDRILFLARDGFLVHKLYEMIRARHPHLPESRYVAASRKMLYNSLFTSADAIADVASRNISFSHTTSIAEYFDIFLLLPEDLRVAAAKAGVSDLHAPLLQQLSNTGDVSEARRRLDGIIKDLAPLILRRATEASRDKATYYRDAGGLDGRRRIGIVDLGWSGTIVEPLQKIINDITPKAEVLAYFFGLTPKADGTIPKNVPHCAYAFEKSWPQCGDPYELPAPQQTHVVFGASLSLMEILLSENCTSAVGLVRASLGDTLGVVRASESYSVEHRDFLTLAHTAAQKFAEDAIEFLPDNIATWDFSPLLAQAWNRILSSPSQDEAEFLASFPHRMDASSHAPGGKLVSAQIVDGSSVLDQYWNSMWPAGWLALLDPRTRANVLEEYLAQKS